VQISTPSMMIWPFAGSTSLNNTWIKVDLPLPVLPTTPIFSPLLMLSVMPFKIRGVFDRYLTWKGNYLSLTSVNHLDNKWLLENLMKLE
jgi:hypothetical protein